MSTISKNIGSQPQHDDDDDEASSHERDGAKSERHKANMHQIPPSVEGKLYHNVFFEMGSIASASAS